ncbi:MAG: ABC transporter permease, partial [Candidatus Puniceispirillales bacterium]
MSSQLSQIERESIKRKNRANWLLSLPALLLLLFAASGPLLIVIVYSFLTPGNYGGVLWEFSGEAWFKVLFTQDIFDDTISLSDAHLSIFWRSVQLSFLTTLICLILGFPTAYFIATRPLKTRNIWLFLITIPFWTNLLIRTFAILELIRNKGVINNALISLGIINDPINMLYTDTAIVIGMTYVYLPLMVLPIYAAMERFDFKYVEAGFDLYASRFKVMWRIILPIIKPGVIAGSILVFVPSLGAYVTPRILGGGKNLMI